MRNILGGGCIVLGTMLSNAINHPILSPIAFSVGILLVITLDLGLITRSVPSGRPVKECFGTLCINLLVAFVLGVLLSRTGNYPQTLGGTFGGGVATGIIIGMASIANKYQSKYTIIITMILMFSFVYLGLPHCVVYAFYIGALTHITTAECLTLLFVTLGNIVGGAIVRYSVLELDNEIA